MFKRTVLSLLLLVLMPAALLAQTSGASLTGRVADDSGGALPGLTKPAARHFVEAVGQAPVAKYGWTDVARFSALGIPALNYGPGDPNLAHTREEHVNVRQISQTAAVLRSYLS